MIIYSRRRNSAHIYVGINIIKGCQNGKQNTGESRRTKKDT